MWTSGRAPQETRRPINGNSPARKRASRAGGIRLRYCRTAIFASVNAVAGYHGSRCHRPWHKTRLTATALGGSGEGYRMWLSRYLPAAAGKRQPKVAARQARIMPGLTNFRPAC